ncbi:hypothetical protein [Hymenobacter daeguensis]
MPGAAAPARIVPLLLWLGAAGLVAGALGLGVVVGTASYGQVQALGRLVYHEFQFKTLPLALTPAGLAGLRMLLAGAGAVGLVGLGLLHRRHPLRALCREARLGLNRGRRWWRRLPPGERICALALLSGLAAARLWYLWSYPLSTDEMGSYDFFASRGALVTTTFYPIPNNHILYNLLAWPLAAAGLPATLAMRLPGLVLGLGGTAVAYVLLARLAGARLALAVTGLAGLAPLWVFYAMAGRGYFLQMCLGQIGFFAAVELLRRRARYPLLSCAALVAGSVAGLYLVPSYAYPLVALGLGLGAGLLWQRRWAALAQLALAATIVGVLTALLYAPVGLVSGWSRLLSNPYIAAKTPAQFWPTYRAFLYESGAALFGPGLRLSGPAWLALAGAGGIVSYFLLGRRRTAPQHAAAQLAALLLLLPLLLMMLQRVYAPLRVLLYLTYFGYLLPALWLQRLPFGRLIRARWQSPLLLLAVLGLSGWRLYDNRAQARILRHETHQIAAAYRWLRAQPMPAGQPRRVWLHAIFHELFFAHYEQQEPAARRDQLLSRPAPMAGGFDYLVIGRRPEDLKLPPPPPGYQARYHDDLVTIYQLTEQPR